MYSACSNLGAFDYRQLPVLNCTTMQPHPATPERRPHDHTPAAVARAPHGNMPNEGTPNPETPNEGMRGGNANHTPAAAGVWFYVRLLTRSSKIMTHRTNHPPTNDDATRQRRQARQNPRRNHTLAKADHHLSCPRSAHQTKPTTRDQKMWMEPHTRFGRLSQHPIKTHNPAERNPREGKPVNPINDDQPPYQQTCRTNECPPDQNPTYKCPPNAHPPNEHGPNGHPPNKTAHTTHPPKWECGHHLNQKPPDEHTPNEPPLPNDNLPNEPPPNENPPNKDTPTTHPLRTSPEQAPPSSQMAIHQTNNRQTKTHPIKTHQMKDPHEPHTRCGGPQSDEPTPA
ncbi:hypothetical protein BS47DRAFT_1365472 [Hydnum rufescens UP504]|uniref:Uncharacterized protein n=1 Tax=Hydnum rufescens UP504 TaxID=1448309 RepID=A0A9P6DPM0_9AGAM|nr:hypothetical protein BS47DRAFT_1365472 [Hydnum rufescens UP504]